MSVHRRCPGCGRSVLLCADGGVQCGGRLRKKCPTCKVKLQAATLLNGVGPKAVERRELAAARKAARNA